MCLCVCVFVCVCGHISVVGKAQSPFPTSKEGLEFAKRMEDLLSRGGLDRRVMPTRATLAAASAELLGLSDGQCAVMSNGFVRQVDAALQNTQPSASGVPLTRAAIHSTDRLWSTHFVPAYLQSLRRGEGFRATTGHFEPSDLVNFVQPSPPLLPPPPALPTQPVVEAVLPRKVMQEADGAAVRGSNCESVKKRGCCFWISHAGA